MRPKEVWQGIQLQVQPHFFSWQGQECLELFNIILSYSLFKENLYSHPPLFETGSYYVVQTNLNLMTFLPNLSKIYIFIYIFIYISSQTKNIKIILKI